MKDIIIKHPEGDYPISEIENDVSIYLKHDINFSPKLVQALINKIKEQVEEIDVKNHIISVYSKSIDDLKDRNDTLEREKNKLGRRTALM